MQNESMPIPADCVELILQPPHNLLIICRLKKLLVVGCLFLVTIPTSLKSKKRGSKPTTNNQQLKRRFPYLLRFFLDNEHCCVFGPDATSFINSIHFCEFS